MPLSERRKFAQANALCWGCLKWGPLSKECRGRKIGNICNRRHPTLLHDDAAAQRDREKKPEDQEKKVKQIAGTRLLFASRYLVGKPHQTHITLSNSTSMAAP